MPSATANTSWLRPKPAKSSFCERGPILEEIPTARGPSNAAGLVQAAGSVDTAGARGGVSGVTQGGVSGVMSAEKPANAAGVGSPSAAMGSAVSGSVDTAGARGGVSGVTQGGVSGVMSAEKPANAAGVGSPSAAMGSAVSGMRFAACEARVVGAAGGTARAGCDATGVINGVMVGSSRCLG